MEMPICFLAVLVLLPLARAISVMICSKVSILDFDVNMVPRYGHVSAAKSLLVWSSGEKEEDLM